MKRFRLLFLPLCYILALERIQGQVSGIVFRDFNGNGIQDANQPWLADVPVELYKETSPGVFTLIASATTDANGNYYFSSASGASTASVIYDVTQLQPNMSYELRFPLMSGGFSLTRPNSSGLDLNANERDSDANTAGVIPFSTDGSGRNDHSFDVGYGLSAPGLLHRDGGEELN